MRVLRVIGHMKKGGIETGLLQLLPLLNNHLEIHLLTLCPPEADISPIAQADIPITTMTSRGRLNPRRLFRIARYIDEHNIDIVHSDKQHANTVVTLAGLIARRKRPLGIISQIHNTNKWAHWRQLKEDTFLNRYRDAVIAVSNRVKANIVSKTGVSSEKCRVVYNGVNAQTFAPTNFTIEQRDAIRAEFGFTKDNIVVITSARLHPNKHFGFLLEHVASIVQRLPQTKFLWVGDGPLKKELSERIDSLGLQSNVILAGWREDVPDLLNSADVYAMPSLREGFSYALLEAMASCLPIVAFDVGGNAEALQNGKSGIIVPAERKPDFIQNLISLIESPDRRQSFAEAALKRSRLFSIEKLTQDIIDLYIEVQSPQSQSPCV